MPGPKKITNWFAFKRGHNQPVPPPATVAPPVVVRALNPIPVPDGGGNSDWTETFAAHNGSIDVWTAVRLRAGVLQVEYQLTCRQAVTLGVLTVIVAGAAPIVITVGREWPAGRSLSGRYGPEFELDPLWDPTATGPLDMPVPDNTYPGNDQAAINAFYTAGLADLRACIASGRAGNVNASCSLEETTDGINTGGNAPWEGPFPCWGVRDGGLGSPGGDGIYHPWGWQNSVEYARYALEAEAAAMTRQWVCVKANGDHASVDDYAGGPGHYSPYVDDNSLVRLAGWDSGTDLLMHPQQTSHYPRVLRMVGAAWEMTRSPLARRHLIQMAEMARFIQSERGEIVAVPGSFIAGNFATIEWVCYHNWDGSPRPIATGTFFGLKDRAWQRLHGWTMYSAAIAKKAGMPWTAGWTDWATRYIAALTYAQMPNGLFAASVMPDFATNFDPVAFPATATMCASMHEAILGLGFAALSYQTGVANTALTVAHGTALYNNPNPGMVQPYYGGFGPYHWLRNGTNDGANYTSPGTPSTQLTVDGTISVGFGEPSLPAFPGDPAHNETYIAVLHKLTADPVWLARSLYFGRQPVPFTQAQKKIDMRGDHALSGEDFISRNWTRWLLGQYP